MEVLKLFNTKNNVYSHVNFKPLFFCLPIKKETPKFKRKTKRFFFFSYCWKYYSREFRAKFHFAVMYWDECGFILFKTERCCGEVGWVVGGGGAREAVTVDWTQKAVYRRH
jgi:Fe-S oxidoreductase